MCVVVFQCYILPEFRCLWSTDLWGGSIEERDAFVGLREMSNKEKFMFPKYPYLYLLQICNVCFVDVLWGMNGVTPLVIM